MKKSKVFFWQMIFKIHAVLLFLFLWCVHFINGFRCFIFNGFSGVSGLGGRRKLIKVV